MTSGRHSRRLALAVALLWVGAPALEGMDASSQLWVAVVHSSNQDHSMEAHSILKQSFSAQSFGTRGAQVKLPDQLPGSQMFMISE